MEQGPVEIFSDTGVLFAAGDSSRGASREIVRYAQRGQVVLVVNKFVFDTMFAVFGIPRGGAHPPGSSSASWRVEKCKDSAQEA
jgi:hypothetical protein